MIYEATREIEAPAARAWGMLSAVETWPQWLPTVTGVEPLDGSPIAVGRRYRVTQPKIRPSLWRVTEIAPGRRFVWRAQSPGLEMIAEHEVEPVGGNARVRLGYEFRGLLGAVLGRMFGGITREYLEREAQTLKARVEESR